MVSYFAAVATKTKKKKKKKNKGPLLFRSSVQPENARVLSKLISSRSLFHYSSMIPGSAQGMPDACFQHSIDYSYILLSTETIS